MRRLLILAALAAPLAACNKGPGTEIAFSGNESSGSIGRGGEVKIDTPVLKGAFTLPKVSLTADNFDMNGVHLYPGSRIAAVDVASGGDDKMTLRFESPAGAEKVRSWFVDQFAKAGTEVKADGNTLTGKTDESHFTIDLTGDGASTRGVVRIS